MPMDEDKKGGIGILIASKMKPKKEEEEKSSDVDWDGLAEELMTAIKEEDKSAVASFLKSLVHGIKG